MGKIIYLNSNKENKAQHRLFVKGFLSKFATILTIILYLINIVSHFIGVMKTKPIINVVGESPIEFNENIINVKILQNEYYYGSMFKMCLINRQTNDILIENIDVKISDIVLDNYPFINGYASVVDGKVSATMENIGWGDAGEIKIVLKEISDYRVKLKTKEFSLSGLRCGENKRLDLFTVDDLNFWPSFINGYVNFIFEIFCDGVKQKKEVNIETFINRTSILPTDGKGDAGDIEYAIFVDVNDMETTHTYTVNKMLDTSKGLIIPFYVLPTQSCYMSLSLTFKIIGVGDEEDVYTLDIFKSKHFIVPYTTNPIYSGISLLESNGLENLSYFIPNSKIEEAHSFYEIDKIKES